MIKKILAIFAALAISLGISASGIAAASTTQTYIYVCNSSASVGPIMAIQDDGSHLIIINGQCKDVRNFNGEARIDPDPELSPDDVDSTWWGYIGHGYDYCDPGEGLINPPNADPYTGGKASVRYNTDKSGC